MGSKTAQNLTLMPNLLLGYVGYMLNLCILGAFFPRGLSTPENRAIRGPSRPLTTVEDC
jgi:hypothetical protein